MRKVWNSRKSYWKNFDRHVTIEDTTVPQYCIQVNELKEKTTAYAKIKWNEEEARN